MPAFFSTLASGSSGNAAFIRAGRGGVLIDCGLGPRQLAGRLAAVGASWADVSAVVLTHTHGDHWNRLSLSHITRLRIPLYAHLRHHSHLANVSAEYPSLEKYDLVRRIEPFEPFEPAAGVRAVAVKVPHDSDPTLAFRFDGQSDDGLWAVGYAADLGCGIPELPRLFAGVDVLALEFNHDEAMERASGRPAHLIARVLGRNGHLSNRQAAAVSRGILAGGGGRLQALVQLHLSRHCNRPDLAAAEGRKALDGLAPHASLVTATQGAPSGPIPLRGRAARPAVPVMSYQPRLPWFA